MRLISICIILRHILYVLDATTSIINRIIWAFCTTEWMLYVGCAISVLDSTSTTVFRSLITKIVQPDEIGKVFSVIAIFQAIVPFIGVPLFGMLYKNTVATQPNAFIFLAMAIKSVVFFVVLIVYIEMNRSKKRPSTGQKYVASGEEKVKLLSYKRTNPTEW